MQKIFHERDYCLLISLCPHIGPLSFKRLLAHFSKLQDAWAADLPGLLAAGLKTSIANNFRQWRLAAEPYQLIEKIQSRDISYLTILDPDYPELLKEISDPPPVLYFRGKIAASALRLGVVGSRQASDYGLQVVAEIIPRLAAAGIEIVSGLAMGIDTAAHQASLAGGGKTIAVLGSGVDEKSVYPKQNHDLAKKILTNSGAIISEFPPGTPPLRHHFPRRNRIIAGLCQAVLVVEASEKSGALITAYRGLDENREVMAIPGNIFHKNSTGTNKIIRAGAILIRELEDIMHIYGVEASERISRSKFKLQSPKNTREQLILDLFMSGDAAVQSFSADDIAKKTQLDTTTINSTLSILEIEGKVCSHGPYWRKA